MMVITESRVPAWFQSAWETPRAVTRVEVVEVDSEQVQVVVRQN